MTRALPVLAALFLPALAAAAEGDLVERRLHADVVTASSFKWNDWNRFQENYLPLYVSDGDPRTTWTEGAYGPGVGEWIRMQITSLDGATRVRLRIRNGYQKSAHLFTANTRPKDVTIRLLPSGSETRVTLTDAMGWQEVVAEQPSGKLEAVELKTESVYPGSKWSDQCISDVELHVTATTRENPAFEKSKLARVKAWRAQRLEAARVFKENGGKDMPLLPGYQMTEVEGAGRDDAKECGYGDTACRLGNSLSFAPEIKAKHGEALKVGLMAARGEGIMPVKLVPADTRSIPRVDGMHVPSVFDEGESEDYQPGARLPVPGTIASLQADQLGVLGLGGADVKATLAEVLAGGAPGCRSKIDAKVYAWALRQKSSEGRDVVRAMLFAECGLVGTRAGFSEGAILQVVVYDAAGRLELTAGTSYVTAFEWAPREGTPTIVSALMIDGAGWRHTVTAPAAEVR